MVSDWETACLHNAWQRTTSSAVDRRTHNERMKDLKQTLYKTPSRYNNTVRMSHKEGKPDGRKIKTAETEVQR